MGSSPLARGLLTRIFGVRIVGGDHPRSRGVYPQIMGKHSLEKGSSPLARGLPIFTLAVLFCPGIIPARAGFTAYMRGKVSGVEDHPRSRGVYA